MIRSILLLLIVSASALLSAQELGMPQLVCRSGRGESFPLELAAFHLQVERHADVAETTITLSFRNSTNRNLEGDFSLPLPEGANITNYALEVNEEMREAVAVGKERARLAYETIKSQNIDPGIVEREAGNVYRTRIFPILRESTKTLRISYLEFLKIDGPSPFRPRWYFPFNLTTPVEELSVTVLGAGEDSIRHESLTFSKDKNGHQVAKLANTTLTGMLTVEATDPHRPLRLVSDQRKNKTSYLTLNKSAYRAAGSEPEVVMPPQVNLIWDCSRSMAGTDFSESYAFLDQFVQTTKLTKLTLYLASNTTEKVSTFAVADGDWGKVREVIEGQDYNGSSDFGELSKIATRQSLTVLVTDGQGTTMPKDESLAGRLLVILPAATPEVNFWQGLARQSGGTCLSLEGLKKDEAVKKALEQREIITTRDQATEFIDLPSTPPFVQRSLVCSPEHRHSSLELQIPPGTRTPISFEEKTVPDRFLQRLSGLGRLWDLEARKAPPREIIAHCKQHGLVSDFTSLIVLERFEDHLRFQIPPPEPELSQSYQARLRGASARNLTLAWSDYLASYRTPHPWLDVTIAEDLKRISIWNRAQAKAFTPEQLPLSERQGTLEWERKARQLLAQKNAVKASGTVEDWKESLNELAKEALDLGEAPATKREGVSVSVQGLVLQPGVITSPDSLSLQEVVETAGGPYLNGTREAVTLYRGSRKTTYNLRSKAYQDVPLQNGDMVVLPNYDPYAGYGDCDPFASSDPFFGGQPLQAASERPAVVEEWSHSRGRESLRAGVPFRNRTGQAALKEGEEVVLAGPDPMSFVSRALELHRKGKTKEARRMLSNLSELCPDKASVTRLNAVALHHFGDTKAAQRLLRHLLERVPHDHLATQLLAEISLAANQPTEAIAGYQTYFKNYSSLCDSDAGLILLTHHNRISDAPVEESLSHRDKTPGDLLLTICSPAPHSSLRILLQDPSGEVTTTDGLISATGVTPISSFGLAQIFDREALPGDYRLSLTSQKPQLIILNYALNFGRENEERVRKIVLIEELKPYHLAIPFSLPSAN